MENFVYKKDYTKTQKNAQDFKSDYEQWDINEISRKVKDYNDMLDASPKKVSPVARDRFISLLEAMDTLAEEEIGRLTGVINSKKGAAKVTIEVPSFEFGYYLDNRYFLLEILVYADTARISAKGGMVKIDITINIFMDAISDSNKDDDCSDDLKRRKMSEFLGVMDKTDC